MKTAKVYFYQYEELKFKELPVLDKNELKKYHTKILLKNKPVGLSHKDKDSYFYFFHEAKDYAVNNGDYLNELGSRSHIPNKKESRKIRQKKAKQKQ